MALYILLPLSLLAFLVLHYVIIPRARTSESSNRWVAKIGKPALVAILKYVSTFFFIATLTYLLLVLVVLVAGLSGATSSTGFESAITRIQGYRDALKVFKSYWSIATFAFIFIAVTVLLYRSLKGAITAEVEKEKQRLRDEGEKGNWESLEPTIEMNEVAKKIYAAQVLFDRLDPSSLPQTSEAQHARKELTTKIQELRAKWHDLDLERRAYRSLGARRQEQSRAFRFFGSKGFLGTLQGTSRAMGHVALVFLFLSLVGVNTPFVDGALGRRVLHLSELQVKANQKEARESFTKLLADESDGGEPELKEEDEKALRDLSRHFERAFTSSHVWPLPYVYDHTAAGIRKDLVRDKIIVVYWENPSGGSNPGNSGPDVPPNSGPSVPPRPGPSGPAPRPAAPPSSDDIRGRLGSDNWPQTAIGERFSSDVRKGIVGKSKKLWGRVKLSLANYQNKFGEPLETLEFGKWAVGEAMGATVDSVWHHVPNMGV